MKPRAISVPSLVVALFLTACVTINIYFPAAQAQEAAEIIVEDILGGEAKGAPVPPADSPASSSPASSGLNLLDWLIPQVRAAGADFSADTPEIRRLQASLKSRHMTLKPFFDGGAIGFTADGLTAVREPAEISLRDRTRVNKLVEADNAERMRLYREIARANGHPEWEKQVRKTFADTWIEQANAGWWYQDSKGAWVRK